MKNYYNVLLLCVTIFSFNQATAQTCPQTGFATESTLYFFYDAGTSLCVDRPGSVGVDTSVFNKTSCGDEYSIYNLASGPVLTDPSSFAADFGFGTCEYSGGTLSTDQFEMIFKAMLRVHPNPVTQGNNLNIELGVNTSVKVNIYNITGKQVLSTDTSNFSNAIVDISSLENGIYITQIVTDLATITRKVIVMK